LFGLFILPEWLPRDLRAPFRWKTANPIGMLPLLRSNRILAGLQTSNFFSQLAHVVLPAAAVLYGTYRYGWDVKTVGLILAIVGVCSIAVQGAAIGPVVKRLGAPKALLYGLLFACVGFFIFGVAP